MKIAVIILSVVLAVVVGLGAYFGITQHQQLTRAKSDLTKTLKERDDANGEVVSAKFALSQSQQQADSITDKYNQLREAVIKYAGAQSAATYKPISCTANTVGMFTYTNCY